MAQRNGFWARAVDLYVDGFRSMTVGKTLWLIIAIKLFVFFVIIKILFFRDLYLFLWFLIPIAGCVMVIIKGYEYKMIPYLLAENPELTKDEAFEMSKEMMHGQKWSAFGLDLSFIGWILLTIITFGILGIFYVSPYIYSTHAALYDTLKEETGVVSA